MGGVTFVIENTQEGRSALMMAAAIGHLDCVRLLLDADADKNTPDKVRVVGHGFCE